MNRNSDNFLNDSISYVKIEKKKLLLKKESVNFFMGSCFAENLYHFFDKHYINCLFSPFGNIYNPRSLAFSLRRLSEAALIDDSELFLHRELWRHFDFDGEKCHMDKEKYLDSINESITNGHEYLLKTDNLILTLGTSFTYRDKETDSIVNNCHKLPSKRFIRENTSIELMHKELLSALKLVQSINKNIKIIITLSPVRHLRDSAVENSLSKAGLRCLIEELSKDIDLWYFPAYEIMMDQLRDYRWYSDDLTHPSEQAVKYIMGRFIQSAADEHFQNYLRETEKLNCLLNHRILHPGTQETQKFLIAQKDNFEKMIQKYPDMKNLEKKYTSHFNSLQQINKVS